MFYGYWDTILFMLIKIEKMILTKYKIYCSFFGENGRIFITFCYFFVLLIFGYLGWNSSKSLFSVIIIAMIGICTYIAIQKWDINSPESSNFYFQQNNIFASMLFLYLLIF